MTKIRGPQRRHSPEFKLRVCQEIRTGVLGSAEAGTQYGLADSVIAH